MTKLKVYREFMKRKTTTKVGMEEDIIGSTVQDSCHHEFHNHQSSHDP